jgi:hypothetical protein
MKNDDRYKAINVQAYKEHKTIEVRLHTGTIEEHKILNWVQLLVSIASAKKRLAPISTVDQLVEQVSIDESLVAYVKMRVEKFKNSKAKKGKDNEEIPF